MKQIISGIFIFLCVLGSWANKPVKGVGIIEVATNINSLIPLKASDFFDKIEYIPLETNSDCLIGNNVQVSLLPDKILVKDGKQSFLFNRQNGTFIRAVGRQGNGPGEYSRSYGFVNPTTGNFYFQGWNNSYVKYTANGLWKGKASFQNVAHGGVFAPPFVTYLNGDTLLAFFPNLLGNEERKLVLFSETSDNIKEFSRSDVVAPYEINSVAVLQNEKAGKMYGPSGIKGVIVVNGKEPNTGYTLFPFSPSIWHLEQNTYFKEDFNDTIYSFQGDKLIPRYIFNTGKYHWPYEKRYNRELGKEHIQIPCVLEGKRHILFYSMLGENLLTGIFDKRNGKTVFSKSSDLITDDINGFMPLNITDRSDDGLFIGIWQPTEIGEWLEKNSDKAAALPANLNALKKLAEDDNPVVVIIHPKK